MTQPGIFVLSQRLRRRLTRREADIVEQMLRGRSSAKTIANRLGVSDRTVETHLHHIRAKLRVSSNVNVLRVAMLAAIADQRAQFHDELCGLRARQST